MRFLWLCALLAFPASGQVIREGLSRIRQEGVAIMVAVYRRPDVAEWCAKNPEGEMTIRVNGAGSELTVHCPTRREFLALLERPPPQ